MVLMRTPHYQLCAVIDGSFLKEENLPLTACRCFWRYSTPSRMTGRRQFLTLFWHQTSYAENGFDYCFRGVSPRNEGFVKVGHV